MRALVTSRLNRLGLLPRMALVLGLILGVAGCSFVAVRTRTPEFTAQNQAARSEWNLKVYDRATHLVSRKYFDATFGGKDWPEMVRKYRNEAVLATNDQELYRTLNQLLQELKASHLSALTPQFAEEERSRRRARVGLMWHRYGKDWVVEDVLPGSPAEAAGIGRGWVVEMVGDVPAEQGIRRRLAEGESVTLVFRDAQDQRQEKTLTACMLNMDTPPQERVLEGGYAYLRFDEFDRPSRRWLSDALKRNRQAPGVVIDLRHNHGGQLLSLDIVVGEFFPHPVSIGRMIRRSGAAYEQGSRQWSSARYGGRVVVLTNDSSYSAAEMFSHVLQYTKRATIIGRKTGGAVIAARNYGLPGGGEVQIPILDYVGLHGRRLEGDGVEPDIPVEPTIQALRDGRDLDIEAAMAFLRTSK